jgi:hypothetical protein
MIVSKRSTDYADERRLDVVLVDERKTRRLDYLQERIAQPGRMVMKWVTCMM